MPRAPRSLSSMSTGRASASGSQSSTGRASASGSQSPTGATGSPGVSSRNTNGRESDNQVSDGEGEHQEIEGDGVATDGGHSVELSVEQSERLKLTITADEFEPEHAMGKAREIVHCHFKGPWIYFSEVPSRDRRIWFLEFKKNFWWEESIQEAVMSIWKMKISEHMRTTFYKARTNGKKPSWIANQHCTAMKERWGIDEKFQHYSKTNKKNRAFESPNGFAGWTGGSKSVVRHIKTFLKIHNKNPTMEELITMTYKKKNGEWSGTRPAISIARFKELVAEAEEKREEVDAVKFWVKAVGVKRGRKIFGLGSSAHDVPLLEKYWFAKMNKVDMQNDVEFHKFREDMENQVSPMKIEIGAIKDQMSEVKTLVQNMALYQQVLTSFFGHPSQLQFQAMQSQSRYPTTVQGSTMATGYLPTSFTSLLNSNSMLSSLDASTLGPSMVGWRLDSNSPYIMRGPVGEIVFTFLTYHFPSGRLLISEFLVFENLLKYNGIREAISCYSCRRRRRDPARVQILTRLVKGVA